MSSSASKAHEVVKISPRNYNEARLIGEAFRQGHPVMMVLEDCDITVRTRLVDFACGLAFALHGAIEKMANDLYFLTPHGVTVSNEDKRVVSSEFFNQS